MLVSNFKAEDLQFQSLPSLYTEFPVVHCNPLQADNDFPALDWIRYACRNMSSRFIDMGDWFENRVNAARYSFIPIGNLPHDAPIFIIDTVFARTLSMNKHLVWYSDTPRPDLGGHEDRNFRIYFQEEMENPEVINKGFYRNYTIELEVEALCSNIMLQSDLMKEFEDVTKVL